MLTRTTGCSVAIALDVATLCRGRGDWLSPQEPTHSRGGSDVFGLKRLCLRNTEMHLSTRAVYRRDSVDYRLDALFRDTINESNYLHLHAKWDYREQIRALACFPMRKPLCHPPVGITASRFEPLPAFLWENHYPTHLACRSSVFRTKLLTRSGYRT